MGEGRHYGMDWLRIAALTLLILCHIALVFVPLDYHVKSAWTFDWALVPMLSFNPWQLPLLFVMSGYASRSLMTKLGGPKAFARSRSLRLLLPLAFGIVVVVPPQAWVEHMDKFGYAHGYLHFWTQDYFRFAPLNGIVLPATHHMWFVGNLWAYAMLLAFVPSLPLAWREAAAHATERILSGAGVLVVPIALLAAKTVALQHIPIMPDWRGPFGINDAFHTTWGTHEVYFPCYLFGYLLAASPVLGRSIAAWWKTAAVVAGAAFAGDIALGIDGGVVSGAASLEMAACRLVYGWSAIVALLGFADRYFNHDHPLRAKLTEGVFAYYIIHQTIIVLVGWWMRPLGLGPGAEALLLLGTTLAGCWIFFRVGRETPGFRLLLGLKGFWPRRRRTTPVPALG